MENMRITKWLHPSEKLWLLEEAIRIEKKTGDACRIETKRIGNDQKLLALFRVPENALEEDVYYPCGCIVYVEDADLKPFLCDLHERPGCRPTED